MAKMSKRDKEVSRRLRRLYNKTDLKRFNKCAVELARANLISSNQLRRLQRLLKQSGLSLEL
jgi:hypothetical protein